MLPVLFHDSSPSILWHTIARGNASQSLLNRTIVLQKRAIRTINRVAYNSHTQPLYKYMKILNLADQYEYEAALFMFKYVNNRLPLSFDHMFQFNHEVQVSHLTRQSFQMQVKRCNSNFAPKKLPLFSFPIIWNKWSHKLIANMSFYKFKSLVKSSVLSKYPENVTILHANNVMECTLCPVYHNSSSDHLNLSICRPGTICQSSKRQG